MYFSVMSLCLGDLLVTSLCVYSNRIDFLNTAIPKLLYVVLLNLTSYLCFLYIAQGRNEVALDTQLYDLVATTPLGEYLNTEIFTSHPEECLDLYHSYLNDFVNSVYRTTKNDEIKVSDKFTTAPLKFYFVVFSWFGKHLIQKYEKLLMMIS